MKYIKVVIVSIILFLIILSAFFQIKVENYRKMSMDSYGVFKNVERQNYVPFAWFYFQVKLLHSNNYKIFFETAHVPYKLLGMNDKYLFNGFYASYLMYSYYNKDSLIKLKSTIYPDINK